MGKGDRRSRRGKIHRGTYGKTRLRKHQRLRRRRQKAKSSVQ